MASWFSASKKKIRHAVTGDENLKINHWLLGKGSAAKNKSAGNETAAAANAAGPQTGAAVDAAGPKLVAADAAPAGTGEQRSPQTAEWKGVKLHVQNMDGNITKEALKKLFEPHGTVKYAGLNLDKHGKSKGFGKVVMSTKAEAEKGMATLNGTMQGNKAMTVVMAPVAEKIKEYGKADKGRGKGKSDKGKGKGVGGQSAYPPESYPHLDEWVKQIMPHLDPLSSQMMQQQMLTWQLYAHQQQMAWQINPDGTPYQAHASNGQGKGKGKSKGKQLEDGKGKGKSKLKGKDRVTDLEDTYTGRLKSINFRNDKGYGFIDCKELKASHGQDVYVGSDLLPPDAKAGDQLEFSITLDQRGRLRAANVKPALKSKA